VTNGTEPLVSAALEPTDSELVARARRGDAHAFEALARRHYRAAFAVALAQMGNSADAEDVCHDGMVRALARLDECRQPDRFAQWLGAIVRNHARNELVRPAVVRSTDLDEQITTGDDGIARRVEMDDLRLRLERALAQLSPVEREVVLLSDLHDWSHEMIAESIGTSPGMSRQHLFKARRRLRELLGTDLLKEHFND
jgi:RNA polymerase sigma-70 factor (ECF subfamily)